MPTTRLDELQDKWSRLRSLLDEHDADAIHLGLASSFSWATCGWSSVINTAADRGEGSLLVERDRLTLIASKIEAPRYRAETDLEELGCEVLEHDWTASAEPPAGSPPRSRWIADAPGDPFADRAVDIAPLRAALLDVEQDRMRALSADCATAMWTTCTAIRQGMTEYDVAAALAQACLERAIEPIVTLVAADDRVRTLRHPRPTLRAVDRLAMVVLCGRRDGLVSSLTRLVHVGPLPDELERRHAAVCEVDARILAACTPGTSLGDVFTTAQQAYADTGFPDEWMLHHQGGLAGYQPREVVATPGSPVRLAPGHACAFNPSIAGTKSEDTVLVAPGGDAVEVLTSIADWPMRSTSVQGLERPDILVL